MRSLITLCAAAVVFSLSAIIFIRNGPIGNFSFNITGLFQNEPVAGQESVFDPAASKSLEYFSSHSIQSDRPPIIFAIVTDRDFNSTMRQTCCRLISRAAIEKVLLQKTQ
jgi:hypothetical protein